MRKAAGPIAGVVFVIILLVGIASGWSAFLTTIASLGGALIVGVICVAIGDAEDKKQNSKYSEIVKKDAKYGVDQNIQQIMKNYSNAEKKKEELIAAGALLLCCADTNYPRLAITVNGGVFNNGFVHKDQLEPTILSKDFTESYTTTSKASATKRAIAGGVLAGGVGAVVGAVSANEANANGGVVHTKYNHGKMNYLTIKGTKYNSYCVSKDVIGKVGKPVQSKDFKIEDKGKYYHISGPFSEAISLSEKQELQSLCNYFKRIIM